MAEIPKSHRNEWKSKRDFQDLIDGLGMYMPYEWSIRDYGIDGQVEITRPIKDSDSFRPESKFFLIQLKSIENLKVVKGNISFPIPVKKIIQWYSANLPVKFVLNDLKAKSFYSLWIDERLINEFEKNNSNWVNQSKITLKIPSANNFSNYTLDSIRDYVLDWKTPTTKIMEPGTYFELKDQCVENLNSYKKISNSFNFESISNSINGFNDQIEHAIYKIAITGPSRVGKSTLINALLRRKDVSPTGIEQTTSVPIQILPGKKDTIRITFKNGKSKIEEFSPKIIEEYASQVLNEDNKKDVTLVAIHLANRQLEKGVSLFDVPGLDDPDENIYNYTWSTVSKANAILYLIDASSYENGGYIFKSEYKKHIIELGQSLDKIFLVFNKVNALTGNKLELLKARVMKDLEKYDLYEKVSNKIYFISAEESLKTRISDKKGQDNVQKLEEDIWSYLLKENKIGLITLSYLNKEIVNSLEDFKGILNARLLDNTKRNKLVEAMSSVNDKISDIAKLYYNQEKEIKKGIVNSLQNRKYNLLSNFESYLKSFPIKDSLPNRKEMQNYLAQGGHATLEETNKEYAHRVNLLKEMIDNWIVDNLKQVREIIEDKTKRKIVDLSSVEQFVPPSIDLSTSFGVGLLAGILGFIINPPAAIVAGFTAFLGNLLLSSTERRAKRIDKIMQEAKRLYEEQFKKINKAYTELIEEHSKLIIDYANKKVTLFFDDLNSQIEKLNEPITNLEEKKYKKSFQDIEKLKANIQGLDSDIKSWYSSI